MCGRWSMTHMTQHDAFSIEGVLCVCVRARVWVLIENASWVRHASWSLRAPPRAGVAASSQQHAHTQRAERRAGALLTQIPKAKGGQPYQNPTPYRPQAVGAEVARPMTIKEMGVTETQSLKWQRLAALPEDKFETRVEHAKARIADMTTCAPSYSKAVSEPEVARGERGFTAAKH
jgi:hypothetical protein